MKLGTKQIQNALQKGVNLLTGDLLKRKKKVVESFSMNFEDEKISVVIQASGLQEEDSFIELHGNYLKLGAICKTGEETTGIINEIILIPGASNPSILKKNFSENKLEIMLQKSTTQVLVRKKIG